MANAALIIWPKSLAAGANEIGCGLPIAKPAAIKMTIRMSLTTVDMVWNAEPYLIPDKWNIVTSQITLRPSASDGMSGKNGFAYSPKAIAASATGAANPTVADSQPARNPNAG